MAYFWLGNPDQGGPSPKETLPPARAAATKALQLDPSLARAHLALGLILLTSEWDWSEAENQYRIALKLNPNCADCHSSYGGLLAALGRNDEANAQTNQAIALDPVDFGIEIGWPRSPLFRASMTSALSWLRTWVTNGLLARLCLTHKKRCTRRPSLIWKTAWLDPGGGGIWGYWRWCMASQAEKARRRK